MRTFSCVVSETLSNSLVVSIFVVIESVVRIKISTVVVLVVVVLEVVVVVVVVGRQALTTVSWPLLHLAIFCFSFSR